MMGELIGLVAVVLIFGPAIVIPVTAMVLKHRKEMVRMEIERRTTVNQEIVAQIEALRREIAELRRTSTEYDMSLQMNLENLQERVRTLEQQLDERAQLRTF
jgi:TolA-binding protein